MAKLVPESHLKTLRAITQPGKTITLDSRIPAHRDHIFHMYRGEGYAKLHMPEQHKALKQVFNNHALGQGLDYKTLNQINEPTTDFVDLISVEFVDYNPATKILRVTAVTSLVNPASIDHHLEIFTKAGEAVDGQIATSPNTTHAEISIETDFDPAEFSSPTLEIHYSVNWFDSESGTMKSQIHSADVGEEILSISPVKSITMKAPINRNTPQGSRIIVCYRRTPSRGEVADYVFPEQIVDNKQELYLDFAANVEFNPAMNAVFKTIDVSTFILRMDCGRGGASYQKKPSYCKSLYT
ncbi:hypothetical protein FACS1894202_12640 [Clostridia bacterium]|nr:hypothetical protein FACS1894202_12640 [Clostridia bacterium]